MDKKSILIIIILIAIIIAIVGLIVVNISQNTIEYETLQLSNTCAISVPISNNSSFTEDDGLKTYNDTNLQILCYNKNDLGTWENLGANIGLLGGLNQNFKYNHTHQGKNILIHPEENKTIFACLITNNTTGDVIVVASQNEAILYHVIDSVNFTIQNNTNISKNTTNATVKTTEGVAKTTEGTANSKETTAKNKDTNSKNTKDKTDEGAYAEGYIAENDQDFDYNGDGVGDGSAYHSHEYYVENGQTEPVPLRGN